MEQQNGTMIRQGEKVRQPYSRPLPPLPASMTAPPFYMQKPEVSLPPSINENQPKIRQEAILEDIHGRPRAMLVNDIPVPYPEAPVPQFSYREIVGLGDVDAMEKAISNAVPMIDEEVMYKYECDHQGRIYLAFFLVGFLMVLLVMLW